MGMEQDDGGIKDNFHFLSSSPLSGKLLKGCFYILTNISFNLREIYGCETPSFLAISIW